MTRYGLDEDSDVEDEALAGRSPSGTPEKQIEEADLWQDEDLGMDDDAVLEPQANVVSDVEDMDTKDEYVLRDAQASFQHIFDQVKTLPSSPPKDEEMQDMEEEEEEEFDDGEVMVEPVAASRDRTSEEDYNQAASAHGSSGICSRITSKVFAGERRGAPTSVDYGRRMGFRVGWSPDGSFLKLAGGSGTKLLHARPSVAAADCEDTKYLDIHKSNSCKMPTSVDDGSSRFCFGRALGNGGDLASHAALRKTISMYAADGPETGRQAFSLLSCFIDSKDSMEILEPMASNLDSKTKDFQFEARRKEAVVRFLVKACHGSTEADINAATARGYSCGAILAALTGGDITKACELAFDEGYDELSDCIATFDADGTDDMLLAATGSSTTTPKELLPVFRLLGGDVRAAGDLDWMRAFLVRMVFEKKNRGLPEVLQAFRNEVAVMTAPFPSPNYARGSKSIECLLYRLLRVAEKPQTISLTEIVDPSGASRFNHDFSLAFHLASCLQAIGISNPMSPSEEAHLIDGYCAQLCSSGRWEWAVYVCLCSLNPDMIESSSTDWKRNKAKELVLRNFQLQDPQSAIMRSFLEEDVGVPKEWMYEALATQQVKRGDPFEYINRLAALSPRAASEVVDECILPNILFMSPEDLERSLALLASFQSELSPISTAIFNLFELSRDLNGLLLAPQGSADEHLPSFTDDLQEIETALLAHRAESEKKKDCVALKFCPSFDIIPMSSMLHEALEHCVFLRLQLKALEMGIEIDGEISEKRLTTLLAFHAVDGYNETFVSRSEIQRALR